MVLTGNGIVDIVILVLAVGTLIYQFIAGKAQEAAHLAEQIAEKLPDGLTSKEKKEIAVAALKSYPFLKAVPAIALSWIIELVLSKVSKAAKARTEGTDKAKTKSTKKVSEK